MTKFYCALMTGTDEPPPPPPVHTAPTPHPHAPHRPELIHHPPSQEAGSGLTPASFAPDGDLRLDTASCEFDAEVAVQLEGALQAGEVVEQGQAAQARAQAGMEGEGSQSLYRAFTRSQPGAALDHLDHLGAALAGGARRALVTCSPVPSCDNSPRCVRAQPLAPALARARARARARALARALALTLTRYVTKDMLAAKLAPPSEKSMVYVCGPPPLYKAVCGAKGTPDDPKAQGELGGLLKDMGYAEAAVFKF